MTRRVHLHLDGAVQGVGMRPLCARLAASHRLGGWVRNDERGLQAEIQGPAAQVEAFLQALRQDPPPLARVRRWWQHDLAPLDTPEAGVFRILASEAGGPPGTGLPPDAAPCARCLDELFDPADRRHRHAFINCTHCGPRFTVTRALPYDRAQTSLADFPLCAACAAEYADPDDRRHHAQPIACPDCGPRLALWQPDGTVRSSDDPVQDAAACIAAGGIVALKGAGGYHLVCDARQDAPLARLRAAKRRQGKPFALMVGHLASAARWVEIDDPAAQALLASPAAPVLLLRCRPGVAEAHPQIAPELSDWGLMLPPTPLHALLLHALRGRPTHPGWREEADDTLLVVTSANPGGEPLVIDEVDALARLGDLADLLLVHDRAIVGRLDDSVRRWMGRDARGQVHAPFVRRARGHVPDPVELDGVDEDAPPVLAFGGHLKNTVCVTRGRQAFLSPHVGDLGSAASRAAMLDAADRLCRFLAVRPALVAHDLHPDYFSTLQARAQAEALGVPALAVQHHHAHAAAVCAEHAGGLARPALALVLDGSGLGEDGSAWGGELLRLQGGRMVRLGHLPTLALPGGDRAAREPWRLGAAVLAALGRGDEIAARHAGEPAARALATLIARGTNCPPTSSAGRLFDAAASLIAGIHHARHEGDAAMRLEALAAQAPAAVEPWPEAWSLDEQGRLRWPGLWARLAEAGDRAGPDGPALAAARFHATLAEALAGWTIAQARREGLRRVALGGGCLINRRLRDGLANALGAAGLEVLEARQAPPGDGGLALGQAAVALARLGAMPAALRSSLLSNPTTFAET